MEKKDIIEFFDRCAPTWDAEMIKSDVKIGKILDNAEVGAGMDILDVACGTGVMFDYYLQRGVASVTGIDISPEMAKIAGEKYAREPKIQVICGDVEEYTFGRKFDRIVVYNAFPHFPYPKRLIKTLAGLLKDDGRLTVAHGMSREAIDGHHSGAASKVSNGLMSAESLKRIFDAHFDVEVVISNRHMYQVSGVKRDVLAHSHSGTTHSHGGLTHCHTHGEEEHDHLPRENATPLEELLVMMKYLVSHNDAHAQEVAELARELMAAGKDVAYDEIMDAVSDFDMVNAKLAAILTNLTDLEEE
ncbi:MAG: class I SAM-dependent methyltransferase [Oscillospiraceae bacterium]|nr:class I SAM-dependent methyltransferase [Oscillospiraceae bacterium]